MRKTNAERQRAYRERHLRGVDDDTEMLERINTMVSLHSKNQLKRLSRCYGVTQRSMLERIINEAATELMDDLSPDQQNAFYDGTLALRSNDGESS